MGGGSSNSFSTNARAEVAAITKQSRFRNNHACYLITEVFLDRTC